MDLDPYLNRELDYKEGLIPTVMIRMSDAEKLLEKLPKKAKLTLISKDAKRDSHDVIAEIKGNEYPNEIITFTAHYDSVSFSKGAYDNGTSINERMNMFKQDMESCKFRDKVLINSFIHI